MEFRREVTSHFLVTFVYFLIVSLFNFRLGWGLGLLWLGALVGTFILDLDHILLVLDPENKNWWAERFRFLYQQKKYKEAFMVLSESHLEHRQLVFHSLICQPILLVLAFFVLTSTGSLFGAGLVMAANLHLLKDLWASFLEDGHLDWFFWQIKQKLDKASQRAYLIAVTFFFLLLTLLLM